VEVIFIQAKTVTTVVILVFLGLGFALALTAKIANPEYNRELAVRERGGEYFGTDNVVLQDKSNTCGPAALKMVMDRYGKTVTLQELEATNHVQAGWSMQELKELAERYGLRSEGRWLDAGKLSRSRFPVLLFVEDNHFVVVDGVDSAGFFSLCDPAIGRVKMHGKALTKIWRGQTLVFEDSGTVKEKF
jgi:ABC-type bacteriocin/lantibiotic exporter with double-glycine peptidase domain